MRVIQNISKIKDIQNWFIVDMGYSNSSNSCGVCIVHDNKCKDVDLEDISFAKLEEKFEGFYTDCNNAEIGLVIEAPLSILFDGNKKLFDKNKKGNPLGRKDFEKEGRVTRYWYYGAGATVALGALEFINRIKHRLESDNIYLFEGFVSFKDTHNSDAQKNEHCNHCKDAKLLYKAIKDNELNQDNIVPEKYGKYTFIGDYLNLKINGIPPIIKVSRNENKLFIIES